VSTHVERMKFRLMTIEFLRAAKRRYTYRELSSKTGLSVTVLSRYAKGHVLPSEERARQLWNKLKKLVGLETELYERIQLNSDGYFDNTSVIGDPHILELAAHHVLAVFAGKRVTKVLTAAADGVPLATAIAQKLGVGLAIAKRYKEVGVDKFLDETFSPANSGMSVTLYLPRNAIRKKDCVLIVDDMIRSGETQRALVNLVKKAKAEITGAFFLVAVGDEWKKKIDLPDGCPVEVVMKIRLDKNRQD